MPEVSIIILNWKGKDDTCKCIDSIYKSDYKDFEIILIDNDSQDDSLDIFRKRFTGNKFSNLHLIANKYNAGLAEGFNMGIRNSKGDYVFLLNNDTMLEMSCISELVKKIKSDKRIAIVSPKIKNLKAYGQRETSGAILNVLFQVIDVEKKDFETTMANGTAMLIRKSVFGKEPFVPEYFGNCEDIYISILARIKGYEIAINPNARLIHTGSVSVSKVPTLMSFHMDKNIILDYFILYNTSTIIRLLPLFVMMHSIVIMMAIFSGNFVQKIKADLWVIRNLGVIRRCRDAIKKQRRISDEKLILSSLSYKMPIRGLFGRFVNRVIKICLYIVGLRTRDM